MEKPLTLEPPPEERSERRPKSTPAPRGGLRLARPFGIEVRIDTSWLIIAFLIVFSLGHHFLRLFPGLPAWNAWLGALATGLLFFLSILLHEMSHSLVARGLGMTVQGITLFVFGGISRIRGEPERPRDEFWMAIVGPLTSVLLGALFLLAGRTLPDGSLAQVAAGWLGVINFLLAGFNLLPGYPLDGGRVFRAGVWWLTRDLRKATRWAAFLGMAIGGGLIVWGAFLVFATPNLVSGLWLGLIGWFLISAAQRSVQSLEVRELLLRYRARDAMRTQCPRARADETIQHFVEEKVLGTGQRCFLVTDGETLLGLATLHELRSVPREVWPRTTLAEVMVPVGRVEKVAPTEPLVRVLERMEDRGVNQLPVVEAGTLQGLVTREDVLRILATDLELTAA
jgi:Zn-dependent protease/CBS domain-containing protein